MKTNWQYWFWKWIAVFFVPGAVSFGDKALAQITPDGTLGTERSVVKPLNPQVDRIDGGALRGANLFHSFQEFNIGEGRGAYFANPEGVGNIFSRVTGGNPSRLFGTLGVLGNANLFFLNPNGIIFGPNAKLDIGGSFVGSTASGVTFPNGMRFSATNPEAPPLLTINVPVPIGLEFESKQPGALVNAGNLAVGTGQNLTLVGGTVVSTGQLSAPSGELAVVTVPGVEVDGSTPVVNFGEAGQFVNWEMQQPISGSSQPAIPGLTLSQLLTNGEGVTGLKVNSNGQVELTGSNLPVATGDVVVRELNAQTATLTANDNLTLVESLLGTSGNLNLLAKDTVRVRDSVANPFIAAAGGQLLLQGNQGVDIFALNHPDSGLFSGGDMVLRSADKVGGDAHYYAGGNFRIENLDGSLGNLYSPHDPVIRSLGDVFINAYQGASLHIIAGGKVEIPEYIFITGADPDYGLVETITLSNGETINIDGQNKLTVDIRAGVTPDAIGIPIGLSGTGSFFAPAFSTNNSTSADIVIGDIYTASIGSDGGRVFLTNQYESNTALNGEITVNYITTSGDFGGGLVTLDSREDITLKDSVFAIDFSSISNGKDIGGNVTFIANKNITTGDINSWSNKSNSGTINLISHNGLIDTTLGTLNSFSIDGLGGNIFLEANGKISTGNIDSRSINSNSGTINLISHNGSISTTLGTLDSFSNNALGGNIFLEANGNITTSSIDASGINAGNINLLSKEGSIDTTLNGITGGNININANQNITTGNIATFPFDGFSGNITLTSNAAIFIKNSLISSSLFLGIGSGGDIVINTKLLSLAEGSRLTTATLLGQGDAGDIKINTDQLIVKDGSEISAVNLNKGQGGNLLINASESIDLIGSENGISIFGGGLFTNSEKKANAGNIIIVTDKLNIQNGAQIGSGTFGEGNAGNVIINASDIEVQGRSENGLFVSRISTQVNEGATGRGGILTIETERLLIRDGAQIGSGTFGEGNGGSITINASDFIKVIGSPDFDGFYPTGLFIGVEDLATGNAGNLKIVTDKIIIQGFASIDSNTNGQGIGGDLNIETKQLIIQGGGQLGTGTLGNKKAGNLKITASDFMEVTGILSNFLLPTRIITNTDGKGNAGDITITTGHLNVQNGATIEANTSGKGSAGNLTIYTEQLFVQNGSQISAGNFAEGQGGILTVNASDFVIVAGNNEFPPSGLFVSTVGTGNAGNIILDTPKLSILNGAGISAFTTSIGNGGSITINSPEFITLSGNSVLSVETISIGKAGNINLTTNLLTVEENAIITATATETATTQQQGGSITINSPSLNLFGKVGIFAQTQGEVPAGTLTIQPSNNQPNLNINFAQGAEISASTSGIGQGGSIFLTAPETISIQGDGKVSVETTGKGNAGNINITTQNFNLSNDAQITASTSSSGQGGNINLFVDNDITLTGNNTAITASSLEGSSGDGGSIFIDPITLTIANGAKVAVNSQGTGTGGDIEIYAGTLTLDNGTISSITKSTDGGNISLYLDQILFMRNGSGISTTAGDKQFGGNGGNINIDAPFIVAFPTENSDITANAFQGQGGNIQISTQAIFGLEYRPSLTPLSDITASSDFGVDGEVVINTPGIDPSRGLTSLPDVPVNTQIVVGCQAGGSQASVGLFNVGRTGLPIRPDDPLNEETIIADWINPDVEAGNSSQGATNSNQPRSHAGSTTQAPTLTPPCHAY